MFVSVSLQHGNDGWHVVLNPENLRRLSAEIRDSLLEKIQNAYAEWTQADDLRKEIENEFGFGSKNE